MPANRTFFQKSRKNGFFASKIVYYSPRNSLHSSASDPPKVRRSSSGGGPGACVVAEVYPQPTLEPHEVRVQLSCAPSFLDGVLEEVVGNRQTQFVLSLQAAPINSAMLLTPDSVPVAGAPRRP